MAQFLRRYTDIPALIYLLTERQITLLDPASWDDKNDSYFLSLYLKKKSLKSMLALCFTQTSETYHHWRVFASGTSGVCIQFEQAKLLNLITNQSGTTVEAVQYLTLKDIRGRKLKIGELPFLKRAAYGDEEEFRIIYESAIDDVKSLNIPIQLFCIDRITLSPWVSKNLSSHLRSTIRNIKGCKKLKIFRSTLIGNDSWKKLGEGAK
jgi:hypothetical protein